MVVFYKGDLNQSADSLSEEESEHCVRVLRHQKGDEIIIFNGIGGKYRAKLTQASRKSCEFEIIESEMMPKKTFRVHLAIAPTKNIDRIGWLIEKLSEIGVDEVSFIQTRRGERRKMRLERLEKKAISAMKQAGNPFLIKLNDLRPLDQFIKENTSDLKYIAHISEDDKYLVEKLKADKSVTILVGCEGGFSTEEVVIAKESGFEVVSLGQNIFRTETAGFVACNMVNSKNKY